MAEHITILTSTTWILIGSRCLRCRRGEAFHHMFFAWHHRTVWHQTLLYTTLRAQASLPTKFWRTVLSFLHSGDTCPKAPPNPHEAQGPPEQLPLRHCGIFTLLPWGDVLSGKTKLVHCLKGATKEAMGGPWEHAGHEHRCDLWRLSIQRSVLPAVRRWQLLAWMFFWSDLPHG
jgi:hypothetical protein